MTTQQRDALWPNGDRPLCRNGDGRRVYLAGLCGDCWAASGRVDLPPPERVGGCEDCPQEEARP